MYYWLVTKVQLQGGEKLGGKTEKAKARLRMEPTDYTYDEAKSLMAKLGFKEHNKGKTSGSRVQFVRGTEKTSLHKPHPDKRMPRYAVVMLKEYLESIGEL